MTTYLQSRRQAAFLLLFLPLALFQPLFDEGPEQIVKQRREIKEQENEPSRSTDIQSKPSNRVLFGLFVRFVFKLFKKTETSVTDTH